MAGTILSQQSEKLLNTTTKEQAKLAYFIMVHRFPKQFNRLFKAIYDPGNYYLIHVDKGSENKIHEEIKAFLSNYPNTHILESEHVVWGGYSMVHVELAGISYLLSIDFHWDFFINLSGQDFPLQSQSFIREFLGQNKGINFMKIKNQAIDRPETLNRIENYFEETETGFTGIPQKRNYMNNVTPYIGGQWLILTRSCCEFICSSPEIDKFKDFYINTLIADEAFFQTILMNTKFIGNILNDDKRAIIWIPDGDIKLRPKTYTENDLKFLSNKDNLFARKFDEALDSNILDILESRLKIYN